MIDIMEFNETTSDFSILNTDIKKAENVLTTQLGYLKFASDFGTDLAYFLSEDFVFQNDAFRSYLLQRLAQSGVDVSTVTNTFDNFISTYIINLSSKSESGQLIK
jgi:hypothetical protein